MSFRQLCAGKRMDARFMQACRVISEVKESFSSVMICSTRWIVSFEQKTNTDCCNCFFFHWVSVALFCCQTERTNHSFSSSHRRRTISLEIETVRLCWSISKSIKLIKDEIGRYGVALSLDRLETPICSDSSRQGEQNIFSAIYWFFADVDRCHECTHECRFGYFTNRARKQRNDTFRRFKLND